MPEFLGPILEAGAAMAGEVGGEIAAGAGTLGEFLGTGGEIAAGGLAGTGGELAAGGLGELAAVGGEGLAASGGELGAASLGETAGGLFGGGGLESSMSALSTDSIIGSPFGGTEAFDSLNLAAPNSYVQSGFAGLGAGGPGAQGGMGELATLAGPGAEGGATELASLTGGAGGGATDVLGAGGGAAGSGGLDTAGGAVAKGGGGIMDSITGSVMKNPLGIGVAGAGLGYNILKGQQQTDNQKALQSAAASQAAGGAQLQSYLQNGTLPPGLQAQLDNAKAAAKAQIISGYAAKGMPTDPSLNSALAQELAAADTNAIELQGKIATNLLQAGLNETQMSNNLYQALIGMDTAQAKSMGAAIANFSSALAGGPKAIVLGGGGMA